MFSFDKLFIQNLIKKDKKSFNQFYLQTVDTFFRYMKGSYTIPDAECNDILSDFYCKFWDVIDSYDPTYSFEAYVWTVFKNLLKDFFKKRRETYFSAIYSGEDSDDTAFEDTLVLQEKDIESFLQEYYEHKYIAEVIDTMDTETKDILFWKFVENKTYKQISSLLGISVVNVRKKMSRIVSKIKQQLDHLKTEKD